MHARYVNGMRVACPTCGSDLTLTRMQVEDGRRRMVWSDGREAGLPWAAVVACSGCEFVMQVEDLTGELKCEIEYAIQFGDLPARRRPRTVRDLQ